MVIVTTMSCRNSPTETDTAIVPTTRISHSQAPLLTDAETAIVQKLFKDNNISLATLQPYRLYADQGTHVVHCNQVINGMEIFLYDVAYSFNRDGVVNPVIGDVITSLSVAGTPKVTPASAGNVFYDCIAADTFSKELFRTVKTQTFNAELGYYDLNAGRGISTKQFILAWKLTIANGSAYPYAYVRADSPALIYYFNGVIID
jgi:Zn-dependent metalloprotease